LRSAIEAANYGQVILLTKGQKLESNTYYAQGGMAAVIDPADSIEDHINDTLATGNGISDEKIVRECLQSAPGCIRELREWGMKFDTDGDALQLGREGGHGASRIVHALGDATGRVLEESLFAKAESNANTKNIKIFDECFALDLLTDPPEGGDEGTCIGAITYNPKHGMQIIQAKVVILAAGGTGVIWRETSNPPSATGDAIAMAFRAGVRLGDMEMMQFHPTTLYIAGSTRSLISEAVRGEGAYLVNRNGERFMPAYHEMAELAPRDIVSRAILDNMVKTGTNKVFLDVRHIGAKRFAERFPTIFQKCRDFDIDLDTELIPVHPAAHYMIGGVRVDRNGRTSLSGLLACGEAACTGLHGANRLASNSLLEAVVFAARIAEDIQDLMPAPQSSNWPGNIETHEDIEVIEDSKHMSLLRKTMSDEFGVVRTPDGMMSGLKTILKLEQENTRQRFENSLVTAKMIAVSALLREESRGGHFRTDYPEEVEALARRSFLTLAKAHLIAQDLVSESKNTRTG